MTGTDRPAAASGGSKSANAAQVERRRTFAIISHPDAGKTTLTEKLLLFGGAIQLAGEVKAKRNRVSTRSDWMGIERERGISVVTSVMTFEYADCVFNLLDTPGHEDFSEDTYRTLTAVDSAVMVIDAARGIEARTRKLFEVCRLRDIPIVTFINKMDRESRDPFDILDEIEKTLALDTAPVTWPIGRGRDFAGSYDLAAGALRRGDGETTPTPATLEEAAALDGASRLTTIRKVALPLAMPAIMATSLFVFMIAWNEFLFALLFLVEERERWTVSLGLSQLAGSIEIPTTVLMAGSVILTIPIIVLFFATERLLVEGLTSGAEKG